MSRRLQQLTEDAIEQGGRGVHRAIEEADFSEELRERLEAKIQANAFKNQYPAAFAQKDMPSGAGKGTRDIASAQPWSGTETVEDASLRMLNDAHKPLRSVKSPKIPSSSGPPATLDMRMKKAVQRSQGERLANARDRMSVYALSQDPNLSEKEREQMRKTLKERFSVGARSLPGSVQGLAALANERIEDAIARGQFKNITRGKGTNVERDYNANSPFLDTTEYFMNKIIQKQEIVPPWIEKQQELVKAAAVFRGRLRNDWKRHAARVIASKGGSLQIQVQRAERYAAAESASNPKKSKTESLTAIDYEGKLSEVIVTETPAPTSKAPDSTITVSEGLVFNVPTVQQNPAPTSKAPDSTITVSEAFVFNVPTKQQNPTTSSPTDSQASPPLPDTPSPPQQPPQVDPFRDPAWQSAENAYHTLAIQELNNLTRSYNLQAPDLAKKPYFSLERELRSCFADVAPQLPNEIKERARAPQRIKVEIVGHRPGGVLDKFSRDKVKVYDSTKPNYGFKQLWNDLWRRQDAET